MRKQVKLKVYGQVQGVFFRMHTQKKAKELGLVGWVKNESDGTVQIIAEGEKEKLNELADWCRQGPDLAEVREVEAEWGRAENTFKDFEIRY